MDQNGPSRTPLTRASGLFFWGGRLEGGDRVKTEKMAKNGHFWPFFGIFWPFLDPPRDPPRDPKNGHFLRFFDDFGPPRDPFFRDFWPKISVNSKVWEQGHWPTALN